MPRDIVAADRLDVVGRHSVGVGMRCYSGSPLALWDREVGTLLVVAGIQQRAVVGSS